MKGAQYFTPSNIYIKGYFTIINILSIKLIEIQYFGMKQVLLFYLTNITVESILTRKRVKLWHFIQFWLKQNVQCTDTITEYGFNIATCFSNMILNHLTSIVFWISFRHQRMYQSLSIVHCMIMLSDKTFGSKNIDSICVWEYLSFSLKGPFRDPQPQCPHFSAKKLRFLYQ